MRRLFLAILIIVTLCGEAICITSVLPSTNAASRRFSNDWFQPMDGIAAARAQLFFSLGNVVTYPALQSLIVKLHEQVPGSDAIMLDNVLNSALLPEQLHEPQVLAMRGVPLLTTDCYFIASTSDTEQYSFLEMDDAVLAKVLTEMGVKYAFARNISDPIVQSNGPTVSRCRRKCESAGRG